MLGRFEGEADRSLFKDMVWSFGSCHVVGGWSGRCRLGVEWLETR